MSQMVSLSPYQTQTAEVRYAGFWLRFAAYVLDALLLTTIELVLAIGVWFMSDRDLLTLLNVPPVAGAMTWAYFAILESSPLRGTVGKHVLGLYVADMRGDPITFWRASARYWLKLISDVTLMVGWLLAAFTPQKQALHDLLAGTLVLRRPAEIAVPSPAVAANLEDYWDGRRWVTRASLAGRQ